MRTGSRLLAALRLLSAAIVVLVAAPQAPQVHAQYSGVSPYYRFDDPWILFVYFNRSGTAFSEIVYAWLVDRSPDSGSPPSKPGTATNVLTPW